MSKNKNPNINLHSAKAAKKDEFYTQMPDIENELRHYKKHFVGKTVFCNCDDPYESNFFKYFALNFRALGLKKLIATCYDSSPFAGKQLSLFDIPHLNTKDEKHAYKAVITDIPDSNNDGAIDIFDVQALLKYGNNVITLLNGDGDFRSEECIELLKEADVVVTNPAFSLFREYIAQLVKYDKKFLVIGNVNAITYKEIFPLIKEGKMWIGYKFNGKPMEFIVPDDYELKGNVNGYLPDGRKYIGVGGTCWYTNLDIPKRHEDLILVEKYSPEKYPKYDNYDAINVDKTADIPENYVPCWFNCSAAECCSWAQQKGMNAAAEAICESKCAGNMGVPITFLDKYNPEQFDIIKFRKGNDGKDLTYHKNNATMSSTDRQTDRQDYSILQDHHSSEENVTESWECQSPSSTNTTQNNSICLEQQKAKEQVSHVACGSLQSESHNQLFLENENINVSSFVEKCNGIIGVPITFLDKFNPTQFEILGITDRQNSSGLRTKKYTAEDTPRYNDLNARSVILSNGLYKQMYARILIRRS